MRISDWSSDVCSSDLFPVIGGQDEDVSGRQKGPDITGFLMIFDDMFAGPAIDFLLREAGRVIGVHPAQQMKAGGRITLLQIRGSLKYFLTPFVANHPPIIEEGRWPFNNGLFLESLDMKAVSGTLTPLRILVR